jgi:hypothetical protein
MVMTTRLTAYALAALACMATSGVSVAGELAPGNAHGVHLDRFDGVVYYSVEQDGYRVVATLASGADELPIRVVSTLGPGQRLVISVPRSADQPPVDFEIVRNGEALFVNDPVSSSKAALAD